LWGSTREWGNGERGESRGGWKVDVERFEGPYLSSVPGCSRKEENEKP